MIQDLVPDDPDHLEALLAADAVHDHVPMDADEVLAVQYAVLVLPGRVDDLHCEVMVPIPNDFAEGVLDGRVVGVYEVAVDVLDCERALACDKLDPGRSIRPQTAEHTDRPAAHNGHLALLLLWRHCSVACPPMSSFCSDWPLTLAY